MALEVAWMLAALVILATVCIRVLKGILGDGVPFSRGPRDFLLDRLARYGEFFTVSLMGRTYTVVTSPETIKLVLSSAHASFPDAYPVQFTRLLGRKKFVDERHALFRKVLLSVATGDGLQKQMPFINSLAEKTVKSWGDQVEVNSVEELEKFVFNVVLRVFWRNVEPNTEEMNQIRLELNRITEGLMVLPINIPGFGFHKAMKTREALTSRIRNEISRRRKAGIQLDDVLNGLMSIKEVEVSDLDICSVMVGTMFAGFETTAALMPWVLKFLDDFPDVRQRVQAGTMHIGSILEEGYEKLRITGLTAPAAWSDEQDGLRQKMTEDKSLTWFKPRSSMPYTLQVIYEVLRVESFLTLPRQANEDVDYNGFVFRKGSYVWASTTSLHFDPKYFPNPREFNPSRFDEKPNPNAFLPFGQGVQYCPGNELSLTETMLFIHQLVTNYSWERCGPDEGVKQLLIKKPIGYRIHLVKRCT